MNFKLHLDTTELLLTSAGAVFITASRTLVIADVHLGKSATFRTRGVPVPEGSTIEDLAHINSLLEEHSARRLVIAGDFVHSSDGMSEFVTNSIKEWLAKASVDIILTIGNHDKKSILSFLENEGVQICKYYETDGIIITHYPENLDSNSVGIAGHIHPGIKLSESRKVNLNLKGFHLNSKQHLVLPSFSAFTGNYYITPEKSDRFIAIASDKLYEIPL